MAVSFMKNPVAGTTQPAKTAKTTKPTNIRETKQGNPYYHTNTGKKVGAGIGILGGLVGTAVMFAMTRNLKASLAVAAMSSLGPLTGGILGGTVLDAYYNHNEKKKADQMAAYNA